MMEAASRNSYELRHGAIGLIAKSSPFRAKIVFTGAAINALTADVSCRLTGHSVTLPETAHGAADGRHSAAEFVAQDHRHYNFPALRIVVLMDVAPANPHRVAGEQDFVGPQLPRRLDFAQLHGARLEGILNKRLHQITSEKEVDSRQFTVPTD
jgi:hypothetical protein